MMILGLYAFLAGIVTILSPCILPILPIVLSSSVGGRSKPIGVIVGFVTSFTFFTLFLTLIVRSLGIPADALRIVSVVVLTGMGLALLFPQVQGWLEKLFAKFANFAPNNSQRTGFFGGILIGLSIGLLWTPCVGPILASVITLALTGEVTTQAVLIILAYSMGTAVPMFIIMLGGRKLVEKIPNPQTMQKVFGVLMIATAVAIYLGLDRNFQTWVLKKFPNYGTNLTKFEDNVVVPEKKLNIAPELRAGGEWIGSNPLTLRELRGKVVLVDFWTYTCINCQRTLPYLQNWWTKYKDKGLVIIGVHSPEFEFEKKTANVAKAIADFGLTYPVMQDNDFATWRAYKNRYWPAKYLINQQGEVVYTHFGEGAYDETERQIQKLLDLQGEIENPNYQLYGKTPEIYIGSLRRKDNLKFFGQWTDMPEYARAEVGATLEIDFFAKQVYLVARSTNENSQIRVLIDDKDYGILKISEDKLYEVVNLDVPGQHNLKLKFEDSNSEVYAFTFG